MTIEAYKERQEYLRDMIEEEASRIIPVSFSEIVWIYRSEDDKYLLRGEPDLDKVLDDLKKRGYTAIPF